MLYRCKECTGTGADSPTILDAIQGLQTSIADLKSAITSLNVLKEEIPKIKVDISKFFELKNSIYTSLKKHISDSADLYFEYWM